MIIKKVLFFLIEKMGDDNKVTVAIVEMFRKIVFYNALRRLLPLFPAVAF